MKRWRVLLLIALALPVSRLAQAQTPAPSAPLRIGAAKVDVTPSERELPKGSHGILDHLYARAVLLDNGTATAALVTVDTIAIPDPLWQTVTEQIARDLGIPATHVLLTATHTHSPGGQRGADYAQKIVDAVSLAKQRLTPGRIGYATGESYINVNRQIIDPKTGRWWEGPNREGP